MDLISDEIMTNSLFLTQNLLLKTENETRIKWRIGNILIIFDYKNIELVKGKSHVCFYILNIPPLNVFK